MTPAKDFSLFQFDPARLPRAASPERAARGIAQWIERCAEERAYAEQVAAEPAGRPLLEAVFGNSPHLTRCMQLDPHFSCDLLRNGPTATFDAVRAETVEALAQEEGTERLMAGLRRAKRRIALLVGIADIAELWSLERVTAALSEFAETALSLATRHLLRDLATKGILTLDDPDDPERGSGYVVLGMGKLGACELNYSSDIDLVVLFEPDQIRTGDQDRLRRELVRATRTLMRIMDERTRDGYVFRTDLRLRPDPGATPLAIPIPAAETYYESVGQNWERMAMIRARPVAGDRCIGAAFLRRLRPFLWRKHLDFAAIEDIHSIKRQITAYRGGAEITVNGHNIKLGRGGIREIEFFAQTQQLIWGGRIPALRGKRICEVLHALAEHGRISDETARTMAGAYRFLRRLEHRLQMIEDEQTHELPRTDEQIEHVALFMGFENAAQFRQELVEHLEAVEYHYARLFETAPDLGAQGALVFTGNEPHPDTLATLRRMGFSDPSSVAAVVRTWHHGRYRATRSERARQLLTELVPRLLEALANTANADAAFARFDDFLGRLPAGVQLLSLFYNNPALLDLVADIMGDAPRLADWLSRNPSLLDYVLTEDFDKPIEDLSVLDADLEAALRQADHFEQVLDTVRRWTNDHKFLVGIQLLHAVIDGHRAGAVLSAIAEAAVRGLWPYVEREFAIQHGRVVDGAMVALAYGKLGGRELMPESDLDLVFVYDHDRKTEASDGRKPIAAGVYFLRLAQRMVSAMTALTAEGRLYEVDLRLRPSGNKGPVATRFDGFVRYQEETAWTWEHMALTRARVIAGTPKLARQVETAIHRVLTRHRDPDRLVVDVADMRRRMAKEHRGRSPWDIKHRRGGLVDVEFIVQYLQLRHGAERPEVLSPTTSEALHRLADAAFIDRAAANDLADALQLWHRMQAILRLIVEHPPEDADGPAGLRNALVRAGGTEDFETLKHRMEDTAAKVQHHFRSLIERPAEEARRRLAARADRDETGPDNGNPNIEEERTDDDDG